jgi:uncharacterized protein
MEFFMPTQIFWTAGLLLFSNLFMTFAWYGHLKYKAAPLWLAILVSWLIALPEYALQVPANRYGYGPLTAPQLKGMQEVISLCVFAGFSTFYLGEPVRGSQWLGYAMLVVAAILIARK